GRSVAPRAPVPAPRPELAPRPMERGSAVEVLDATPPPADDLETETLRPGSGSLDRTAPAHVGQPVPARRPAARVLPTEIIVPAGASAPDGPEPLEDAR